MNKIIFLYRKTETESKCIPKSKLNLLCAQFCKKFKISLNSVKFIYNQKELNLKLTQKDLEKSPFDKIYLIIVFDKKEQKQNDKIVIQSKILKCPKCAKFLKIIINDDNPLLYECEKGHEFDNLLSERKKNICCVCTKDIIGEYHICKFCNKYVCSSCNLCIHEHYVLQLQMVNNYNFPMENMNMDNNKQFIGTNGKITITYINDKKYINNFFMRIKIFGTYFVNNNRNKCTIIYQGKNYDLNEEFIFYESNDNLLEITLIGINNITDMSCMFEGSSLFKLDGISDLNTSNIIDMSYLFSGCSSLKILPDISNWNTRNVTDLSYMFSGCKSLEYLPDISKWNTSNVKNMSNMFSGCSSLLYLPDISKWDTSKVNNMGGIFHECSKLSSLPDITKWNTFNLNNIAGMFSGCSSLVYLPDISKWEIYKLKNISYLFSNCISLSSLPDISKLNFYNKNNYKENMFSKCISLINTNAKKDNFNILNNDYI